MKQAERDLLFLFADTDGSPLNTRKALFTGRRTPGKIQTA